MVGRLLRRRRPADLRVRDAMSEDMLTVEPVDLVREAARRIIGRGVAAAVVEPGEGSRHGIITARDVLDFVAAGRDPDAEPVGDHSTREARSTPPDSPLGEAAEAMTAGGFRHLVVADEEGRIAGIVSMRDIVRCWVEARATPEVTTPIRKSMNTDFLAVSGEETVRQTVRRMSGREVAAAVIDDDERPYPGIFTERELLEVVAAGADPDSEPVQDRLASRMTFSAPDWSLKQAAEAMTKGGFQHVLVVDRHEIRGVLAMRDIVRAWTEASSS